MPPNPCFNVETHTDCPDRHAGCAVGCPKWAAYVEERNAEYKKRQDEIGVQVIINNSYSRRKQAYYRKYMRKQRWKNN